MKILRSIEFEKSYTISQLVEYATDKNLFRDLSQLRIKRICQEAITEGQKQGILKKQTDKPISFTDFVNIPLIKNWTDSLRGSKFNHPEATTKNANNLASTQLVYANYLWEFNNWLAGQELTLTLEIGKGNGLFMKQKNIIELQGFVQFFELFQENQQQSHTFALLIKSFLNDPIHKGKKIKTIINRKNSILSIFNHNEISLTVHYNPKNKYKSTKSSILRNKVLTLNDLWLMLTKGTPSKLESAVIMCLFQRGLDVSSMADRFNFEAWDQLVKAFGTDDFKKWDLDLCPIQIDLERIKTDYDHPGFLERDAIVLLQEYLASVRTPSFGKIKKGDAIFLNRNGNPIKDYWISEVGTKLAKKAEIQEKLDGYDIIPRNEKTPHELRDLLNSTMIACGSKFYAAETSIGHVPQSGYTKTEKLYQMDLRKEYVLSAKKINIFSKMTSSNFDKLESENQTQKEIIKKLNQKTEEKINLEKQFEDYKKETSAEIKKTQLELVEMKKQETLRWEEVKNYFMKKDSCSTPIMQE